MEPGKKRFARVSGRGLSRGVFLRSSLLFSSVRRGRGMRPLLFHCLQAVGRSKEKIAIKSGVSLRECDRVVTKVTDAEGTRVPDISIVHLCECKLPITASCICFLVRSIVATRNIETRNFARVEKFLGNEVYINRCMRKTLLSILFSDVCLPVKCLFKRHWLEKCGRCPLDFSFLRACFPHC